jgi:hypothetical protein
MAFFGVADGRRRDLGGEGRAPKFIPLTVYRSIDGRREDAPDMAHPRAVHLRGLADLALGQQWARGEYKHLKVPAAPKEYWRPPADPEALGLIPSQVRVGDKVRSSEVIASGNAALQLDRDRTDLHQRIAVAEGKLSGPWETLSGSERARYRAGLDQDRYT